MRHRIRRESHLSVIPVPNMRPAMSKPEHAPHATSTRTVQRHTRPMNRDIQRSRMQSTVRQRKNSVRWNRRRRCRTSHQTHRRPDRKCIRYALQSLISMMWQTESRHLNSERMTEDTKKGDILEMMEFADGKNTGRMVKVLVTYILEDYTGIENGYCIMATKLMKDGEA